MKKIILYFLLVCSLLMITGCGKEETKENKKNKDYKLGEVVETDVARVQLISGDYSYALSRTGDDRGIPKEYDPTNDDNNPYVAAKGNTLVAFTFFLENLDRSSIDLAGSFNDTFIEVEHDGKKYSNEIEFVVESEDYLNWESHSSMNILLMAGKKNYYRAYMNIETDVIDFKSDVKIIFHLPSSNGKTKKFTYNVTQSDRENFSGVEITLDTAKKNFRNKISNQYFAERMDTYTKLTGDEITTILKGVKYNVSVDGWDGTYKFEESMKIYEGGNAYATGYTNKKKWKVDGDILVLSWTSSKGQTYYDNVEVYTVEEGIYLFVNEGKPFGIIYK